MLLGCILLLLAVLFEITLFAKALLNFRHESNANRTLWELFLICTTAGMIILLNVR